MKRWSILLVIVLCCSMQGHAQFWLSFGWNEPHCKNCLWMENAIRLTNRQAAEYHKIIHKYGEKIEREARKHHRYWDQSAERIYKLRMERDRKLQRILSPSQFDLYVRYVRETPTRIHDWRGWYNHPHYPKYRPSTICRHYENHYWHHKWGKNNHPQHHKAIKPKHKRPDNKPHFSQKDNHRKDRFENRHPNWDNKKENNRGNKDRKGKNQSNKEKGRSNRS